MNVILIESRVRKCLPRHRLSVLSKMNTLKQGDSTKMNVHKVTKTIISSPCIYKPVGPYSQAILADKTLYVSGILGMDPQAQLVCGGAEAQARQALHNLRHVLEAGGASFESVVKTTILLARMDDFQAVNHVYAEWRVASAVLLQCINNVLSMCSLMWSLTQKTKSLLAISSLKGAYVSNGALE